MAEVWGSQPCSCEHGRAVPITCLSCDIMDLEEMPFPLLYLSIPEAGRRAGSEVLGAGELALARISCSIGESGPYSTLGEHSRADLEGIGVGDLTPRTGKQENWLHPLLIM